MLEVTKVVVPARRAVQKSGAHEAGPSTQPLDQPPDGKQSDFQLWLALSPEEAQPLALREPPAEVLQQGGWPAWFLEQVWVWTSQLQWGRQDHLDRRDRGITYLELLANFVVSTGTCPPVTGASPREMLDPLTTAGVLQPLYLRNAVAFLVQAVRFLERRTKAKLWIATAHHRVWSLRLLGDVTGRKGLALRPRIPQEQATFDLLCQLWDTNCGETLRECAWRKRATAVGA